MSDPVSHDRLSPAITGEDRRPSFLSEENSPDGLLRQPFEFNSRGARVVGHLHFRRPAPDHLILLAHGAGESCESIRIEELAKGLAGQGAAVAAIDLPLHGRRSNPKLTPKLLESLTFHSRRSSLDEDLWRNYADQASADFAGCLEVLPEALGKAPARSTLIGLGLGAFCGAIHLGSSQGLSRAVFVGLGKGPFPKALQPGPGLLDKSSFLLVATASGGETGADVAALAQELGSPSLKTYPSRDLPEHFTRDAWDFLSG